MILGHSRGFSLDTYSGGPGLARLQGIVKRNEYPGVALHKRG